MTAGQRWPLLWPASARGGLGLEVGESVMVDGRSAQVEDVDPHRGVFVTVDRYGLCHLTTRAAISKTQP